MWYDPSAGWGAEWFDPDSNDGAQSCGPIEEYETGQTALRAPETHRSAPGVTPSGPEIHCIRPGRYTLRVWQNDVVIREFDVEYVQAALNDFGAQLTVRNDSAGGITERMVSPTYIPRHGGTGVVDLRVAVDIGSQSETGPEVPRLDIENAGSNVKKTTFRNQTSPNGSEYDAFRVSVARSEFQPLGDVGGVLSKIWWDTRYLAARSGYYDAHPVEEQHLIIPNTYQQYASSGTTPVGMDLMRPNEAPGGTEITRNIQITRLGGVNACIAVEGSQAWMGSDQLIQLGYCASRGPGIEYSWQLGAGAPWTPYSSADSVVEFYAPGAGTTTVSLRVRNAGGQTDTASASIQVLPYDMGVQGPIYITQKQSYTYTANYPAGWYERFAGWPWTFNGVVASSMNRIWALGNYHVDLRADSSVSGVIRRGRLGIDVCTTNCDAAPSALMSALAEPSLVPDVFGGGPVLSWGSAGNAGLLALYDLTGAHEQGSPFQTVAWMENTAWRTYSARGYELEWRRDQPPVAGVEVFEFRVTPGAGASSYQFAFALDPDLGPAAWDDRTWYDAARQMLVVRDGTRALGIMMLREGAVIDPVGRQFGTIAFAPRGGARVWQESRTTSRRLFDRADDVQLLLSGGPAASGNASWKVVMIQGADIGRVQALADSYLGR